MAAVTTHSDFGTHKMKSVTVPTFSPPIVPSMKLWDWKSWSSFLECWVLSQLFHSPLLASSRGSLVSLQFLPFKWCHLPICCGWYFSQQSWFQLVSHSAWHIAWCTLYMLNEQDDKQSCHILFQNFEPASCFMSVSNCCFLTCIQVSKKPGKVA